MLFQSNADPEPLSDTASGKAIHWCDINKALTINWSEALGYPCLLTINGWHGELDWHSLVHGEHEPSYLLEEPGIDLLNPSDDRDLKLWQQSIPEDILALIAPYGQHRFLMLRLASQWKEAQDLLLNNPVLFWLWMDHCRENKYSEEHILEGLRNKQSVILQSMGLIGSASTVRILRRLSLDKIDAVAGRKIKALWKSQSAIDELRHCQIVNKNYLDLLYFYTDLKGTPLLHVIAAIDCLWQQKEVLHIFRDCQRMRLTNHELRNCRTEISLRRIHDRYALRMNRNPMDAFNYCHRDENGFPLPFPPAPHPGTDKIKPITSFEELLHEGRSMHHCVSSYGKTVQDGNSYIYHMEEPQRATIGLTMRNGEISGMEQMKGVCNVCVNDEARALINSWFAEIMSS